MVLLGFRQAKGFLQPDSDRVKPVLKMPVLKYGRKLLRVVGVSTYYAQWMASCSEKLKPLVVVKEFPLWGDGARHWRR